MRDMFGGSNPRHNAPNEGCDRTHPVPSPPTHPHTGLPPPLRAAVAAATAPRGERRALQEEHQVDDGAHGHGQRVRGGRGEEGRGVGEDGRGGIGDIIKENEGGDKMIKGREGVVFLLFSVMNDEWVSV